MSWPCFMHICEHIEREGVHVSRALYSVGKVVNTHGLRGELKLISHTDFPDVRFSPGSKLVLLQEESGQEVEVEVQSAREHKGVFYVLLKGLNHINDVERYKGWMVKVAESELLELEEDEYYYHEIIGCRVVTEEGEELGDITEILSPGANDVWVVKPGKGKEILLPVIDEVLVSVDVENKVVTVRLMEGLI